MENKSPTMASPSSLSIRVSLSLQTQNAQMRVMPFYKTKFCLKSKSFIRPCLAYTLILISRYSHFKASFHIHFHFISFPFHFISFIFLTLHSSFRTLRSPFNIFTKFIWLPINFLGCIFFSFLGFKFRKNFIYFILYPKHVLKLLGYF